MKIRLLRKRIRAEPCLQPLDPQGRVRRLHVQLQISPRPPAQRQKLPRRIFSARQKLIHNSLDVLPVNLVAISFLSLLVVQRFCVRQSNRAPAPFAHREHRISRRQLAVVNQNAGLCVCRNCKSHARKSSRCPNPVCAHNFFRRNLHHLHYRQWIAHELPVVRGISFFAQRAAAERHRFRPLSFARVVVGIPIELCSVHPQAGLRRVISIHMRLQRRDPFFFFHFPSAIRVRRAFRVSCAMQQKSCPFAHLRDRRMRSEVPHQRRQRIPSRMQQWRNVVRFIAPMRQIRPAWPSPCLPLIHVQNKLIVRAHVHNKSRRRLP